MGVLVSDVKKNVKALKDNAAVREQQAYIDLVDALERCKTGNTKNIKIGSAKKITASLLAKEAGRSRSIIYATHSELLDEINKINRSRGNKHQKERLDRERKDKTLRQTIEQLNLDKKGLAQENYRIQCENDDLRAKLKRVGVIIPMKK